MKDPPISPNKDAEEGENDENDDNHKHHHHHHHHRIRQRHHRHHHHAQHEENDNDEENLEMEWTHPKVEVILSRPSYRLGETIVGTVRLVSPMPLLVQNANITKENNENNDKKEETKNEETPKEEKARHHHHHHSTLPKPKNPREYYISSNLYIAGRCKVDPRWHNLTTISSLYGTHPLLTYMSQVEQRAIASCIRERNPKRKARDGVVVFWCTNVIDLLDVKERDDDDDDDGDGYNDNNGEGIKGSWKELKCDYPLMLEGSDWSTLQIPTAASPSSFGGDADGDCDEKAHENCFILPEKNDKMENGEKKDCSYMNGHGKTNGQLKNDLEYEEESDEENDANENEKHHDELGNGKNPLETTKQDADLLEERDHDETDISLEKAAETIKETNNNPDLNEEEQYNNGEHHHNHHHNHHHKHHHHHHHHEHDKKWEEYQISLTFRATLPQDLPHSAHVSCVARYFYSVVVSATTADGQLIVVQAPFSVLSSRKQHTLPSAAHPGGRVKIGTVCAIAHSSGPPCYVSSSTLHRPSRISVNRDAAGLCSRNVSNDKRSLRVKDQNGTPCCFLTLVGTSMMSPGGRAMLHFSFDEDLLLHGGVHGSLLPCHQVAACLCGEEKARYEDGKTRRTRSYMFDTAYSLVEAGCTDSISLSLALPLDCPCTLSTDLAEVSIMCKVELTVDKASGEDGYDVLRLELPCKVVHGAADDEGGREEEEDDVYAMSKIYHQLDQQSSPNDQNTEVMTPEIKHDLTMLSLHMIDECASHSI